jgi:hypothetical protein
MHYCVLCSEQYNNTIHEYVLPAHPSTFLKLPVIANLTRRTRKTTASASRRRRRENNEPP